MTAPTHLRADHSVLRMVLAEIGAMERPFVLWLAEMEAIDLSIFQHLHEGWIDRFGSLVVSMFGLADQPALRRTNLVRGCVQLRAFDPGRLSQRPGFLRPLSPLGTAGPSMPRREQTGSYGVAAG